MRGSAQSFRPAQRSLHTVPGALRSRARECPVPSCRIFLFHNPVFSNQSICFFSMFVLLLGEICAQKRHTFLRMCLHLRRTRGKRGFSAAWVVVPPQFLCGFKRKTPHKSSYRTSPFQIADCNSRSHYITNISILQAFSQKAAWNFSAHQNGIDLDAHHRAAQ